MEDDQGAGTERDDATELSITATTSRSGGQGNSHARWFAGLRSRFHASQLDRRLASSSAATRETTRVQRRSRESNMAESPRRVEVELLTAATNHAVIQLPERAFPGSVVPGDSLANLLALARAVRDGARRVGDAELVDDAAELHDLLRERLLHYQSTLSALGRPLSYSRPVDETD